MLTSVVLLSVMLTSVVLILSDAHLSDTCPQ